jgi:DNA N-6-adenine-methyltransferase (Dam)
MANAVAKRQMTVIPPNTDADAAEIGRLYALACSSLLDSSRYAIECGEKLTVKKESMKHGEWGPWVDGHFEVLGFRERAARYMMAAASNRQLTADLNETTATTINRKIWGNKDSQLVQQHLSNEHYTPKQYLDAAREVLGSIDIDPASCAEANQVVNAAVFFTADDDGLTKEWNGNVWLNPPYGRLVGDFIAKFIAECKADNVKAGIVDGAPGHCAKWRTC